MILDVDPVAPLNGAALIEELASAGLVCEDIYLADDRLRLIGLDESDRATAEAVVAAHTGQPTAEQQAELDAYEDERQMADRARQVVAKARRVLGGTDTFTNAQIQQIVAALVIYLARQHRR